MPLELNANSKYLLKFVNLKGDNDISKSSLHYECSFKSIELPFSLEQRNRNIIFSSLIIQTMLIQQQFC